MTERYHYAQIDETNRVISISDLAGPVEAENMIRLENPDTSILGKVWDKRYTRFIGNSILPDATSRFVSLLFFRNLFTNEEMHKLYGTEDVGLKIWLDDLRLRKDIAVDDALKATLQKMVDLKILEQPRYQQLLDEINRGD